MRGPPARRGQHHRPLAAITLGGLALAAVVALSGIALPRGETLWHRLAAPAEDGAWRVVTIDGADVTGTGYAVGIRWSRITSFHDGCNSCGIAEKPPHGDRGGRMTTCTLVGCPPRRHDALFYRFVSGAPRMEVRGDRLTLTLAGHKAELIRSPPDP